MAPIRRYLRITKYSVLECRIYLDNPALAQSWLLNPKNPVLPKVIESVRPLVLPKLREERERSRKKSTKKKGIKDVVAEDDFEVSIFLTETSTRHSLLFKHKHFRDTTQTKLTSNSSKLTGASAGEPIDVDLGQAPGGAPVVPGLRHEDSDGGGAIILDDVPSAQPAATARRRPKRRRRDEEGDDDDYTDRRSDDGLEISDDDPDADGGGDGTARPSKRFREATEGADDGQQRDDKKKLAMDISYEGFSIYGRVLCLVVKRRGDGGRGAAAAPSGGRSQTPVLGGQATMENWISSTQMPAAGTGDELDAP